MRPARRAVVMVAGLLAVGMVGAPWLARHSTRRHEARAAAKVAAERALLDADLAFFEARVARDPRGAADRLQLAQLHVRRAHATAGVLDWERAEALARASLELRSDRNARAWGVLATALVAQHRFAAAESAAARQIAAEPWVAAHRAQRAEILLELGRYAEARVIFDSLRLDAANLALAPRQARWLELTGAVTPARRLLEAAAREAGQLVHLSADQAAWYWWRLADFELRHESWSRARTALRAGLALSPDEPRLVLAAARLAIAEGKWQDAVHHAELALAAAEDATPLAVLADAYRGAGDSAGEAEALRALERVATGGPLHRAAALALLDRGRATDAIYHQAREELARRGDVYTYDVVAWAAYRQGRRYEARAALDSALRLGTADPLLARHRAVILAAGSN